jgi:hypothetical protein
MPCCKRKDQLDVDVNVTYYYKIFLTPGGEIEDNNSSPGGGSMGFTSIYNVNLQRKPNIEISSPTIGIGGDSNTSGNCTFDQYDTALYGGITLSEYIKNVMGTLEGRNVDSYVQGYFSQPRNKPINYVRQYKNTEELRRYGLMVAIRPDGSLDSWGRLSRLEYEVTFPLHFRRIITSECCYDCGAYTLTNVNSKYDSSDVQTEGIDIFNRMT